MPKEIVHVGFALPKQAAMRTRIAVIVLCIACVGCMFAACGASTTTTQSTPPPTPTAAIALAPKPNTTQVPTPKPTPMPAQAAAPTPTPAPAQGAPAILDLRPASMSILGHRDCQRNGTFSCLARVLSGTGNQSDLHWSAYTNVPGHIVFSPASGVLTPGQSVLITITVPLDACTPGLFFFRGPVNTHTITWAC